MADQTLNKNIEFIYNDFDIFKQDEEIENQYQTIIHHQGLDMEMTNYSHGMIFNKSQPINQNLHMQQVPKTIVDYSDEEQDDNYRAIKNLTYHCQTQQDQDHVEDQWNGQNENQGEEFQDDIKYQILNSGEGININKTTDANGSTETMINKYNPNNLVFSASNSIVKEQQNGSSNQQTKGKTLMGSSIIGGVGALDQSNASKSQQQQLIQNQQKTIQSSQSLQNNKQGFKMIKKEKNNNLLSSSSLLQPKSMTNIDQQQMGGINMINNNNSQFLPQNHQNNLGASDFREQINNSNNLRQSINNGLGDSSILMQSTNNGIQLRNPAQNIQFNEMSQFYNKNEFKNQNYLGSSLINPQQEQLHRSQQQFQQEDQIQQQPPSQSIIQQQQQQQQLIQNDNNILNKVKSEDCSSTNEQQPLNQINGVNSTNNNNNHNINSSITASLNMSANNNNSQTISPQIPTQMVTPPHQPNNQTINNQSGHFSYKQTKGSNASTAEIKRPTKKVEVVTPNQSQIGLHHSQNHQLLPPPPQQIHPQFQQNFLSQIPNGLGYPNPNQPQAPGTQQNPYGYPYSQPPQPQPQQFASQQTSKGFMPPHYGANPHLSSQYSYLEQQHQQSLLPTIQNPYSQELENLPYSAFLQPPFQPGGPQQPNPAQPQNPGYDYINPGFNGLPYNPYNQNYPQHQGPNSGLPVPQSHHLFSHIPQMNQPNGFNPAFPLSGLRPQAANLATSNHDLNSQQFNHVSSSQNAQISQFKIKEEAYQKGLDDKNSSSSQNNNNINNYQNGSLLQTQNLNNSNQLAPTLNGSQNQNSLQNQYNLLQGPNQYAQMMLPKQGQQLLPFQEGINGQANISDSLQQANNALKLAQNQQFLGAQLNQFNTQHQQQQFLQQNQLMKQQQLKAQQQQQQQNRLVTNNNLDEESRDNEEEDDDNINSDGIREQEANNGGKPKRPKNETKNIPKNYAKAFLRYIIDKDRIDEMKKILKQIDANLEYDDIKKEAKNFKKNMNAIKDVRKIWQDETNDRTRSISKFMRIASHQFLQKEAISYIFSSNKIKNSKSHIIYRHVMGLAMADPEKFNNIKSLYKNAYES